MEAHGAIRVNKVNYPFPEGLVFEDKWSFTHISVPLLTLLSSTNPVALY